MRFNILAALLLVTGCTPDVFNTYVTNNYYELDSDLTDSDTADTDELDTDVADTDTDCVRVPIYFDADGDTYGHSDPEHADSLMCEGDELPPGYVFNADDCDDQNPIIHPDAIEVLGDGIDTNCDGEGACEYMVESEAHGMVIIENEIQITLSSASPSGAAVPGYGEMLRVNIASLHSECGAVVITGLLLNVVLTDNASSGWVDGFQESGVDVRNHTVDPYEKIMFGGWNGGGDYLALGSLLMMPGSVYTLSVYGDTTGASSSEDDSARVDVESVQFVAGYNIVTSHEVNNLPISGGTFVY